MKVSGKRMFAMLHKLGFERLSTFEGEKQAANIIVDEIKKMGIEPKFEYFMAPHYEMKVAEFEIVAPFTQKLKCVGYGFSGNAAKDGLTAEMVVIEGFEPIDLMNVKGKIAFYAGIMRALDYEKLIRAGAIGFVTTIGTFLDKDAETDMDERMLRAKHLEAGQIPGVAIKVKDALKLITRHPTHVKITLEQEETEAQSQNIVVELPGTNITDEIVVYTAHYDTVKFSKGYFDNSTGTAMNLEFLRYFVQNPPLRTVRFIFCGSEERGLLGSKAYVATHSDEMDKIRLCINMDMAGPILGREMATVTGEESFCNALTFYYKAEGYAMKVIQDIYSSDSIPFSDAGVPSVNFFRDAANGTSKIHCRYDVPDVLSAESLAKTANFVLGFSKRVINAPCFPIERKIPDNIVKKIDEYLMKKK